MVFFPLLCVFVDRPSLRLMDYIKTKRAVVNGCSFGCINKGGRKLLELNFDSIVKIIHDHPPCTKLFYSSFLSGNKRIKRSFASRQKVAILENGNPMSNVGLCFLNEDLNGIFMYGPFVCA